MFEPYKVYVKTDDKNRITAVNSSAFLPSLEGWQEIDSGFGDRYHHAQGNYLLKALINDRGFFNYKLVDGKPQLRTEEEIEADYVPPVMRPSAEERITQLEEALTALLEGATE